MPLEIARSRPGLRNLFDGYDDNIRNYFSEFRTLVDSQFSLEVLLAYSFFRLEQGQRIALYCGARRLHKTDSDLTWRAIDGQHMIREVVQKFFQTIFGEALPRDTQEIIEPAEKIRDRLMHGRGLDESEVREAVSRVLYYAQQMNEFIQARAGFRPFVGDLRGFVGRLEAQDAATSRWILKGMGFNLA